MTSDVDVFLVVCLLFLGVVSLALAAAAGSYSVHGRGSRSAVMAALGIVALLAMVFVVLGLGRDAAWGDVLWPMLVTAGGAVTGVATGLALVYLIVAQR